MLEAFVPEHRFDGTLHALTRLGIVATVTTEASTNSALVRILAE
jgi:hypothetical protein